MFAEFFMSFEIETNTKFPSLKQSQTRLTNLALLSIEHEYAKKVNFDEVIDKFAEIKAGKERL